MKIRTQFAIGIGVLISGGFYFGKSRPETTTDLSGETKQPALIEGCSVSPEIGSLAPKIAESYRDTSKELIPLEENIDGPDSLERALWQAKHSIIELTDEEKEKAENEGVSFFAYQPGQHLTARFADEKVIFNHPDDPTWQAEFHSAQFSGVSSEEREMVVTDNTLRYQGEIIDEWFINGKDGIEQGWTIHRPLGGEMISLNVPVSGLTAEDGEQGIVLKDQEGNAQLKYENLLAYDGNKNVLPAQMWARAGGIQISVDARDAVYPVTIDPLVTTAELSLAVFPSGALGARTTFGESAFRLPDGQVIVRDGAGGRLYIFENSGLGWELIQRISFSSRTVVSKIDFRNGKLFFFSSGFFHIYVRNTVSMKFEELQRIRIWSHKFTDFKFDEKTGILVTIEESGTWQGILRVFRQNDESRFDNVSSQHVRSVALDDQFLLETDRELRRIYLSNGGQVEVYEYPEDIRSQNQLFLVQTLSQPTRRGEIRGLKKVGEEIWVVAKKFRGDEYPVLLRYLRENLSEAPLQVSLEDEIGGDSGSFIGFASAANGEPLMVFQRQKGDLSERGVLYPGMGFQTFPEEFSQDELLIDREIFFSRKVVQLDSRSEISEIHPVVLSSTGPIVQEKIELQQVTHISRFGSAIDAAGELLAVGAPDFPNPRSSEDGRVFLFEDDNGSWNQVGVFRNHQVDSEIKNYGMNLSLGEEGLLVQGEGVDREVVELISKNKEGEWSFEQVFRNQETDRSFGNSLEILGDRILISGSVLAGELENHVTLYRRGEDRWESEQVFEFQPDDESTGVIDFGDRLSLSSDSIFISAFVREGGSFVVRVYHYQKTNSERWEIVQVIREEGSRAAYGFEMTDTKMVITSTSDGRRTGALRIYRFVNGRWERGAQILLEESVSRAFSKRWFRLLEQSELVATHDRETIRFYSTAEENVGEIQARVEVPDSRDALLVWTPQFFAVPVRNIRQDQFGNQVLEPSVRIFRLEEGSVHEAWRARYFGTRDNAGAAADLADPNGDGVVNLMAYAYQLRPDKDERASLAPFYPQIDVGESGVFLEWMLPEELREGLVYEIHSSQDLETWITRMQRNAAGWSGSLNPLPQEGERSVRLDLTSGQLEPFWRLSVREE